jgi:uncharacterized protein
VILQLHVQPGASRSEFAGRHGEALIAFLSDHFKVPKRNVRILSGLKSQQKRVQIDG